MKQYNESTLDNEELRELLLLGRQWKTAECEEVVSSLCYKKVMSLTSLTFPPFDDKVAQLELLSAIVSKSQVATVNLENIMINENHRMVLANLVKSESLHTLYIKFNNMRAGAEASASELTNSKSLKIIYVSFSGIFNHSKRYSEIIEPIIKITTLCNLTFKFFRDSQAKFFVDIYKTEIDSMVDKRSVEIYPQIIRENFYQGFCALHQDEISLPVDIIGVVAKNYANATTLLVEYNYDCV